MKKSPFASISIVRETQKLELPRVYKDSAQLFADGHKFFCEKLQGAVPLEAFFDSLTRTLLLDKEFVKSHPQYSHLNQRNKKNRKDSKST